jgi:hypothetical protein
MDLDIPADNTQHTNITCSTAPLLALIVCDHLEGSNRGSGGADNP